MLPRPLQSFSHPSSSLPPQLNPISPKQKTRISYHTVTSKPILSFAHPNNQPTTEMASIELKPSPPLQPMNKTQKPFSNTNFFHFLSDEPIFIILNFLTPNPLDRKSFSLVCKSFYSLESKHRRTLTPLRSDHLPTILSRYPSLTRLDLTLCPRITRAEAV